jgi:hypothetical protein
MKRQDILTMKSKEMDTLKIVQDVIEKRLKQRQAARLLGLSTRQTRRLCGQFRREGPRGLIHDLRGRPSNHQLPVGCLPKALHLVRTHYDDFGPTLANEKLIERHGLRLSTSTLRTGMIAEGLWTARRSGERHRAWRERRPCVGMMVQLDGSDHDWFEGRGPRCVLLIFIDDATSRILHGVFIPVENTHHLMTAVRDYLTRLGRPVALYVDKGSIYRVNRRSSIEEELSGSESVTQFTRAMTELDIEMIFAHSPQAKGRVERGFHTHQDRLVKELRLAGISTMPEANRFLNEVHIPRHNARFAVEPKDPVDAHRPLLGHHRLDEILSVREDRVVGNDFTLRQNNRFFQLAKDQPVRVLPGNKVTIQTHLDGDVVLRYKDNTLKFTRLDQRPYRAHYVARRLPPTASSPVTLWRPPKSHPWKDQSYRKMRQKKEAALKRKHALALCALLPEKRTFL